MTQGDRKRFLEYLHHEMDAIDTQLDQWRAETRGPGGRSMSQEEIQALEQRRNEIRKRSKELEDFKGDAWDDARKDVERAQRELKQSIDDAQRTPH